MGSGNSPSVQPIYTVAVIMGFTRNRYGSGVNWYVVVIIVELDCDFGGFCLAYSRVGRTME